MRKSPSLVYIVCLSQNVYAEVNLTEVDLVYWYAHGSVRFFRKLNFAPGILRHMYLEVKLNFGNISQDNFFDLRPF